MAIYSRQPSQTKQADCEIIEELKKDILNLDKSNEETFATLLKLVKWGEKKVPGLFLVSKAKFLFFFLLIM